MGSLSLHVHAHDFLLNNGLYIAILLVFAGLCVAAPIVKGTNLLTPQNLLNILQQASPRMFLALGVAGLILQTGTDLSIGRMVGMSMVASTVIMHQGPNTGTIFGVAYDFSGIPVVGRIVMALVVCVALCTFFSRSPASSPRGSRCTGSCPPWPTCWSSSAW